MKKPLEPKNSPYKEPLSKLDEWFDYQEEKRQKERDLPINEMDDTTPIYDTDGMPFEEDCVFNDVSGMTAPPSEATIEKALGIKPSRYAGMPPLTVSEGTLKDMLYGVTDYHEAMINRCRWWKTPKPVHNNLEKRIGVYSLKGKRPVITSNKNLKLSDEDLTYENEREFAYAVATRTLDFYGLLDVKHRKLEDTDILFEKLVKDPKKRMYNLPDQYLAMDILICNTYCRGGLEKYTSKKLMPLLVELSMIEHFKVKKRTKEDIEKRAKEILFPLKREGNKK